jgi:hypothetical protein
MNMVMTLVWYPWTEGQGGPAGTRGEHRTLDLHLEDVEWPRLPGLGETVFFADGGSANIEQVGWKLDGTAYLYLGNRYEKRGELLAAWLARGFKERPAPDEASTAVEQPAVPEELPPMPGQPGAQ